MHGYIPVGKTKDQGWEIGVRRTFPISPEQAWTLLMTQPGLGLWLGQGVTTPFQAGATFVTAEGTRGEIRSCTAGSLIRLRWQPRDWNVESTLQIRVHAAKTGATISVHHERLENAEQRAAMQQHWSDVLAQLSTLIAAE